MRGIIAPTDPWVLDSVTISLAGLAAELRSKPGSSNTGAGCQHDLDNVYSLLDRIGTNQAQKRFLIWRANWVANDLIEKHWLIVQALARKLQAERYLDRDGIIAAVRSAPGGYDLLGEEPPPLVRHFTNQRPATDDTPVIGREGGVIGVARRTADGYFAVMRGTKQRVFAPNLAGAHEALQRLASDQKIRSRTDGYLPA